ncbi:uncharacterized protein LOC142587434 [Dermacentor variabilis]|uniref:uncharacterized protein LOC142587434 n=1 Tax=Dermacentor variabilis TaxID=34621 RepID=UPI003F5B1A26
MFLHALPCSCFFFPFALAQEKKNKRTSKSRQKNVEATFRKKQLEALYPEEKDHKTEELEQEVATLRAENIKLSARIEMLEKALCSKIFNAEKRCCEKSAHGDQVLASSERSMKKAMQPSGSAGEPKPAQQPIRSPEGPVKGRSEETPSSNLHENGEPNSGKPTASVYKSAEGQVHLGKNVYITEALYNCLMAAKTDSRFVREAAVAIF